MCEGSFYYAKHREATSRESLQVRVIPGSVMRGLYETEIGGFLVCIRKPTEVTIAHLKLEQGMAPAQAYLFDGKRNVRASFYHASIGDYLMFGERPNQIPVPLYAIKIGTKIEIGQPAKPKDPTAKGMAAVQAALTEQEKTKSAPVENIVKRVVASAKRRFTGKTKTKV
jgi:hypothetical protein